MNSPRPARLRGREGEMSKRQLSEQECIAAASGQRWQCDDGRIMPGPELAARMSRFGIADAQYFQHSRVGEVLKTGVSLWERIT